MLEPAVTQFQYKTNDGVRHGTRFVLPYCLSGEDNLGPEFFGKIPKCTFVCCCLFFL